MQNNTYDLLTKEMGIDPVVLDLVQRAENEVREQFDELDDIAAYNQYKVLDAMQKNRISDMHFRYTTGYGYDDPGREAIEKVWSDVFHTEAALVRPIITCGTHALTLAITGVLRPGDEMIYCTGAPYDTLEEVVGIRGKGKGSLAEFGITYKQVELEDDGSIDLDALDDAVSDKTRMICMQRSTGYGWRPAITIDEIGRCCEHIRSDVMLRRTGGKDIIIMLDNCYGEFMDTREPTDVGVDLIAGSLIKNPGGGICLTGGYVAGKKTLIDLVSYRMTSPGVAGEVGLMFDQSRTMLQGLFLAPKTVNAAVKGAILCARVFELLGYETCPASDARRSDIIQSVKLRAHQAVISFCRGIQKAAPVDSFVTPEPWDMPGYDDQVIMAAGAFVQGSSIELSADAPIREPYIVYFQGGLTYEHSKFGVIRALQSMVDDGIIIM